MRIPGVTVIFFGFDLCSNQKIRTIKKVAPKIACQKSVGNNVGKEWMDGIGPAALCDETRLYSSILNISSSSIWMSLS